MENQKISGKSGLRTTNVAVVDALLMVGLLAGINLATVGWRDWGWMELNPTPWLLVPLFMGARYGFGWGVASGTAVAGMIYAGRAVHVIRHDEALALADVFTEHLYFFLILPGIGFLTGETQGLLSRKLRNAESQLAETATKEEHLRADLDIAEEARFQVQERLALLGAEQGNLDRQLRGLFEPAAGPVFPGLLRILRDVGGVTDAAMYAVDGPKLSRIAAIGSSDRLPESLFVSEVEMARLAIDRRSLTTIKELWQDAPDQNGDFVAALPLQGTAGVTVLLLIHRMQFLGTTWRNFNRIQMVCQWVARLVELRGQTAASPARQTGEAGALVVAEAALERTLEQAAATRRDWNLPSTLAVFEFKESVPETVAQLLPQAVGSVMRPTDVGSLVSCEGKPVFKVLLPMEGMSEAKALLEKAQGAISRVPQLSGRVVANLTMIDRGEAAAA